MQILSYLHTGAENSTIRCLQKFVFFGYKEIPQRLIQDRMSILEKKGAKKLEEINCEAYYLPASSKKDHVIIFAHTSSLWQFHPKNYDHLKGHADVVLWDPSQLNSLQYKKDLQSVINKVQNLYPHKTITIIGRCATVDPAIAVAAELQDEKINLVLDRGHGNIKKLARSQTYLSSLPIIQNILLKLFDCQGENRIKDVPGKILFTRSEYDQLMKWGKEDLTSDLIKSRGFHNDDQILDLPGDHWSLWNQDTHQEVYNFIGLEQVDVSSFPKISIPPTFFARNIFPILTQGWF